MLTQPLAGRNFNTVEAQPKATIHSSTVLFLVAVAPFVFIQTPNTNFSSCFFHGVPTPATSENFSSKNTKNVYVHPVSVSLPQELRVALAHIWEEQKFTDVDFLIDGQTIPAHKAVLASQSQYFEGMLFGSMREASMNSVELKDVPVPAFRKVLQFAYTGCLDMENVALQVTIMHCVFMVFC